MGSLPLKKDCILDMSPSFSLLHMSNLILLSCLRPKPIEPVNNDLKPIDPREKIISLGCLSQSFVTVTIR